METVDIIQKLFNIWNTVVGAGPVGWIVAGVLALIMLALYFYLRSKKNEQAHKETQDGRNKDQGTTPAASQGTEHNMDTGVEYVDSKASTTEKPRRP